MATHSQSAKKTAQAKPNLEDVTNGLAGNMDHIVKANAEASQVWLENCSKISQEMMDFASSRWNSDLDAMRQFSECRDVFQAWQLQTSLAQTLLTQYMDEAAKLANLATEASVSCFRCLDNGVREAAAPQREATREKASA